MQLVDAARAIRSITEAQEPLELPNPSDVLITQELQQPQYEYLLRIHRYVGYAQEAASVGDYSMHALFNPAGSSCLAVVRLIVCGHQDNAMLISSVQASNIALFDNDGTEHPTDPRNRFQNSYTRLNTCELYTETRATTTGTAMTRLYPRGGDGTYWFFHETIPFVLLPGSGVCLSGVGTNKAVNAMWEWTEQALTPEDRQGVRQDILL